MMNRSVREALAGKNVKDVVMPKVTFIKDGKETTVEFEHGKLEYQHHGLPESFLDVAMNLGIPLEHACGGSCACTTCHLIIREGRQNLSETEDNELDRLDTAWDLTTSSRLGLPGGHQGRRRRRVPDVHAQLRPGGRRAFSSASPTSKDEDEKDGGAAMKWTDAEDIGIALFEKFPAVDPLTVRFTDLRERVMAARRFRRRPEGSNEPKLEAIQMAWYEEWKENQ